MVAIVKKKVTAKELKKLSSYGMTKAEMADFLGMARSTFYQRLAEDPDLVLAIAQGEGNMAMSVKRKQFNMAKAGNTSMLIWVGKQYLGQQDKIEHIDNELPPQMEALLNQMTKEELLKLAGFGEKPSTADGGDKNCSKKDPCKNS